MAIPERYQQKDSWPHTFSRSGQVQEGPFGTTLTHNYCTHCHIEYWHGKEPRPVGVCRARKDKAEYRRILG